MLNWTFTILEIMWLSDMVEENVLDFNAEGITGFSRWLLAMRI